MNKQDRTRSSSNNRSSTQKLSSTSCSSPVVIPTPSTIEDADPDDNVLMESGESGKAGVSAEAANTLQTKQEPPPTQEAGEKDAKASLVDAKPKTKVEKKSNKKNEKRGKRLSKKSKRKNDTSESENSDSDSSDSDSSDSEDEREKRLSKKAAAKKAAEKRKAKLKARAKAKRNQKSKKHESSDSSSSDSDSDSDSEYEKVKRKKKAKARKKAKKYTSSIEESSSESSSSSSESDSEQEAKKKKRKRSKAKLRAKNKKRSKVVETDSSATSDSASDAESATESTSDTGATSATSETFAAREAELKAAFAALQIQKQQTAGLSAATAAAALKKATADAAKTTGKTQHKKNNVLEFKRVDQVWDSKIRDYKYTESVEEQKDDFDSVFTVRRRFGWDNKYIETQVDIKSKLLRNVLQVVFKDCKSISLVEDKPSIQPHMLFHYYNEIKKHVKKTLKSQLKRTKKRKDRKQLEQQISQGKLLLRYIDEDYEETRKTLKPMLKAGTITYNLVWALFKPNTVIYTPTYGNKDDPRCFKVDYCYEEEDWFGNKKWNIEGRYLEYDGKVFGLGDHFVQIASFKGPKKISNLAAYPLEFYKDPEGLREELIERGKKFVALQGMNYRFHSGLGYMKVKRTVAKININGRVMVDPAIFRRINPNYPLSYIKQDELGEEDEESDDESDEGCCSGSESDGEEEKPKGRLVMWKDKQGKKRIIHIPAGDKGPDITSQKLDTVEDEGDEVKHVFSEEELLIASPVVLGFTFSEKLWLEFSLSGIKEIEWNDEAFDNLVISKQTKQNLKGLVSSHRFNAARTIDDVIVGKGKGLNVVLHGPPGVGKTLTGESIAEYLRCPLYAVSSGELGTNAGQLERDLNRIMDITHSWGAILLLDEADVFLEARQPHDIHRNALVSVFLRLTEYYQGILFLTTNRVATFDEAFQSRIHMGIRYENLTAKARKKIWQHHVGKVLQMSDKDGEHKAKAFQDSDFDELSKKVMNGRQIKNAVKTSQAIAISEKGVFGMEYVKRVMEAHESFEEDMKGGLGYRDAMRQYT